MESNLEKHLQVMAVILIVITIPAGQALGIHWAVTVVIATVIGTAAYTAADRRKPDVTTCRLSWLVAWNTGYSGIVAFMLATVLY